MYFTIKERCSIKNVDSAEFICTEPVTVREEESFKKLDSIINRKTLIIIIKIKTLSAVECGRLYARPTSQSWFLYGLYSVDWLVFAGALQSLHHVPGLGTRQCPGGPVTLSPVMSLLGISAPDGWLRVSGSQLFTSYKQHQHLKLTV